jgi:hypothetical protein
MSVPIFRSAREVSQASGSSITVPAPDGTEVGDLLFAVVAAKETSNIGHAASTGWVEIHEEQANTKIVSVQRRIADGTANDDFEVIGINAGATGAVATVLAYDVVDASDPIGDFSASFGYGSWAQPPEITTDENNTAVLIINCAPVYDPPPNAANAVSRSSIGGQDVGLRVSEAAVPNIGTDVHSNGVGYPYNIDWISIQVQINASNVAPDAPTLGTPADGTTYNLPAGFTFTWAFSDPDVGDDQSAYAFRRRTIGAYEYWDAGSNTWGAGEVYNASVDGEVVFPASKWTTATTYEWSVRTKDTAGVAGPYAANRTVTALAPPVVTATDPTGSVTTTGRPPVEWTLNQSPQQAFQVKIESGAFGAAPGAGDLALNSGEVASAVLLWLPTGDLDNGESYRAFVRAKAYDQWSDWDSIDFDLDIDAPSAPTLTVDWEPAANRVVLQVTGTHVQATYPATAYRVEYSDDGDTWLPVRGAEALTGSGTPGPTPQTVYDYEAPAYSTRTYRAYTSREV